MSLFRRLIASSTPERALNCCFLVTSLHLLAELMFCADGDGSSSYSLSLIINDESWFQHIRQSTRFQCETETLTLRSRYHKGEAPHQDR